MNINKSLKFYYVAVYWFNKYDNKKCDDLFNVCAYNKEHAKTLVRKYYGDLLSPITTIKVKYRFIYTLCCRIFNKIPKAPKCKHI